MSKTRTTVPLALSTVTGLAAATLMFVMPGEAAPTPTTFSAEARADVWRVNRLDLDMSGDPAQVDMAVAGVTGLTGQAASSDRSRASARNLESSVMPAGQQSLASVESVATATQDTAGTKTAAGAAGTVTNVLDFAASTLTARGRWGGDTTCLSATTPLTQSRSISNGSGIVPAAIPAGEAGLPIPVPTEIPTEISTVLPSDFPSTILTDLPSPTLPTDSVSVSLPTDSVSVSLPTDSVSVSLPTDSVSVSLPTDSVSVSLPTDSVSVSLPTDSLSVSLPTDSLSVPLTTLLVSPARTSARAAGDVSLVSVAPASVEERTLLETVSGTTRRVYAEAVGTATSAGEPIAEFFGGEATLTMTSPPKLTAYSTGTTQGSQVDWTPAAMVLTVDGVDYEVPTDGTAIALPYSQNKDVVLTLSVGALTRGEAQDGTLAQAVASALDIVVKNGANLVLDAELFPMSVKAVAPSGGVDCSLPEPPALKDAQLKLKGKSNGAKADKLKVNAIADAVGAKATVFKLVHGKKKKVGSGALNAKGDRVFKLKDKNGNKPTKYLVKVKATELTQADKATKKLR